MPVQMSSLLNLVRNGVGSKQVRINYASTYNALDAIIHSTLNNHDAFIMPHNTAGVSRGAIEKIHEVFVEARQKASHSDHKRLGKFDETVICAGTAMPDMFSIKNRRISLSLCHLYVQSSFGKRKPYKDAPHHVDLAKFESGFQELVSAMEAKYGTILNLGMLYFGNDSEYVTPWLDIESAINRVLDFTDHMVTVYVPHFLTKDPCSPIGSLDLKPMRVNAYSKSRSIEKAT